MAAAIKQQNELDKESSESSDVDGQIAVVMDKESEEGTETYFIARDQQIYEANKLLDINQALFLSQVHQMAEDDGASIGPVDPRAQQIIEEYDEVLTDDEHHSIFWGRYNLHLLLNSMEESRNPLSKLRALNMHIQAKKGTTYLYVTNEATNEAAEIFLQLNGHRYCLDKSLLRFVSEGKIHKIDKETSGARDNDSNNFEAIKKRILGKALKNKRIELRQTLENRAIQIHPDTFVIYFGGKEFEEYGIAQSIGRVREMYTEFCNNAGLNLRRDMNDPFAQFFLKSSMVERLFSMEEDHSESIEDRKQHNFSDDRKIAHGLVTEAPNLRDKSYFEAEAFFDEGGF